jgi:NADPH2:quinone reductase
MKAFNAFRIHAAADSFKAGLTQLTLDELTEGDVVIEVAWSSINYKDALAATGRGRILRAPVLNGGIDLAGHVISSQSERFKPGDAVCVCGAGLSETLDGGYAEIARLPAERLLSPPAGLSLRDTMAIGTAGLTAAIAIQRMEDNGQTRNNGPILVTGATGGVGSCAINMLSQLGYEVVASSGKADQHSYLHALGASRVIDRHDASGKSQRPLEKAAWGGAVDSIGGDTLAWLASSVKPWGNIACIGLAGGVELHTTVMPLILRGVSLLGINSIEVPDAMLQRSWERLATDLKPGELQRIAPHTVTLAELPTAFDATMAGEVTGRTVVAIRPDQ